MAKPQGAQPSTLHQHARAVVEQAGLLDTLSLRYQSITEASRVMDRAILRGTIQSMRARLGAIEYLLDEDMKKGA